MVVELEGINMMVDSRIQGAASLLRERPRDWAVVAECVLSDDLVESAEMLAGLVNIGAQIRSGRDGVFQPPGAFEVGVDRADKGKGSLCVRFVPESTVGADVLSRWDAPFADVGTLMVGSSGFLGDRLPRPLPLVLADVGAVVVRQDSPLGVYLLDPDENVVEVGWVSGVTQAWQLVQAANARLDGNLPHDFLASSEVRSCMESLG